MNSIQNLVFVVFDLNQERRTDPRSGTKNFPRRTVNCSTENQFHFALSNPNRYPQPRYFFLPPGEASHASPDGFPEIILVVIVPLFVYKLLPTTNHLPPTTALSPPGAKASASLPRMFLRASLPRASEPHFLPEAASLLHLATDLLLLPTPYHGRRAKVSLARYFHLVRCSSNL